MFFIFFFNHVAFTQLKTNLNGLARLKNSMKNGIKVYRLLLIFLLHVYFHNKNPKIIINMLEKNCHKLQVLLELIQTSAGAVVITY